MRVVADQIDHCPYCRTRVEIVCLKFRFSSVATLSACPNCAMIVPEAQHGKKLTDRFSAGEPANTVAAIGNGFRARHRYSWAFLVAAVMTAAVLRHAIHIQAGIAPTQIRGGALAAAIVLALVFAVKKRRP
jgi:hypothetical protein